MKKILAIIGSPRKGETYAAVNRFIEEVNRIEAVEVETIMLSQTGFSDCSGCHNCFLKGRETCKESKRVAELLDKMKSSDAVILSSPVYNQSVTALMKKFLDYFTYLWHRPEMFGIKFFGISSGGGVFKGTFKLLKTNVESWGGQWMGELGVAHYEALTPKFKNKLDQEIVRKARAFAKGINNKALPVPSFSKMMMFNIWKINAKACKDSNPADYAYWVDKDLFDKEFYYPVKINLFKKMGTSLITAIAKSFMRKVYVGYDEV